MPTLLIQIHFIRKQTDQYDSECKERREGNPDRRILFDSGPFVNKLDQKRRQNAGSQCTEKHEGGIAKIVVSGPGRT